MFCAGSVDYFFDPATLLSGSFKNSKALIDDQHYDIMGIKGLRNKVKMHKVAFRVYTKLKYDLKYVQSSAFYFKLFCKKWFHKSGQKAQKKRSDKFDKLRYQLNLKCSLFILHYILKHMQEIFFSLVVKLNSSFQYFKSFRF